jgi:hypothetical protein
MGSLGRAIINAASFHLISLIDSFIQEEYNSRSKLERYCEGELLCEWPI